MYPNRDFFVFVFVFAHSYNFISIGRGVLNNFIHPLTLQIRRQKSNILPKKIGHYFPADISPISPDVYLKADSPTPGPRESLCHSTEMF